MSTRNDLSTAVDALDPLLDAYGLSRRQVADHVTGETPPAAADQTKFDALVPIIDQLVERHGIALEDLAAQLVNPIGETVNDVIELAADQMTGETRTTWMSKLNFFSSGWSILVEHLPDAIKAAEEVELRVDLSDDPDDYPHVKEALKSGTRTRLVLWEGYGNLPMEKIVRSRIVKAGKYKRADTLTRAAWRDRKRAERGLPSLGWTGDGAVAGLYQALRFLRGVAIDDRLIDGAYDPFRRLSDPTSDDCNRRALTPDELRSRWRTVLLYASDPDLDRLLLKFLFHTGARRDGAINLTLGRLDWDRQSVELLQKYGKKTEVPVCGSLLHELEDFAHSRGSTEPDHPVFRVNERDPASGELRPLSDRHFDTLHEKIQTNLAWAGKEGWTAHWARHHAKAQISQIAGPAAAQAFLDHVPANTNDGYGKAQFSEVAWAVARMTGEPHPKAVKPRWID